MSEHFTSRCAVLVVDLDLERLPDWQPGPLPVRHGETTATSDVRRRYFNERTSQALHGADRVHLWADENPIGAPAAGFEVIGLELLRVHGGRGRNALLAVHGGLAADGLQLVDSLARIAHIGPAGSSSRAWFDELLAGFGRVGQNVRRAATVSLVVPARAPEEPLSDPDYAEWTPELQWLWLLASATPTEEYRPPPEYGQALLGSLVSLSADWRALVLRDGAAFLGSGPDIGPVYRLSSDPELHFRSIYLDSLLLGHVQRLQLSRIADDLAALGDPVRHPERLVQLEQELTTFRNVFWWQQLGPHWHGNELLAAYQRQQEIPELLAEVVDGLEDFSRQARTTAAQRTSALLGLLTIVGLPATFAIGLMRALGIEELGPILLSLVVAALVSAAILSTRTGRTLVRPLMMRKPPRDS